ncbi:MAG TPA: STAS domain-containing protein [Candidatus Acidoferrales bacterium]|nr:STAS domain-containing protein [Candidatus Acidoferrales bacterium]
MEITERRSASNVVTLSLAGRLDTTTARSFEEKILDAIDSGDRKFVIDLSQLEYISSSGLRVFLLAAKRLSSLHGRIVLCSLKPHIRQVFDLAGFSSILSIYAARDEALESF